MAWKDYFMVEEMLCPVLARQCRKNKMCQGFSARRNKKTRHQVTTHGERKRHALLDFVTVIKVALSLIQCKDCTKRLFTCSSRNLFQVTHALSALLVCCPPWPDMGDPMCGGWENGRSDEGKGDNEVPLSPSQTA